MSASSDDLAENPPADADDISSILTHATGSWRVAIPAQESLRAKLQFVSSLLSGLEKPVRVPSLLTRRSADQPVVAKEIDRGLTVGRHPSADWSFPDVTKISRIQFRIFSKDGSWWIEDTASKNGTFLEGSSERIRQRPLANGDVIKTGGLAFAFILPE